VLFVGDVSSSSSPSKEESFKRASASSFLRSLLRTRFCFAFPLFFPFYIRGFVFIYFAHTFVTVCISLLYAIKKEEEDE
jgi:hypothetical protein